MRNILILGAGHSTPLLIQNLLDQAQSLDAHVTVADADGEAARGRVGGHPRGEAIAFDVNDAAQRERQVAAAAVVVNLLPPAFQELVARSCLEHRTHMVSASYRPAALAALDGEARRRGVTLLCELGLDPGIDIMSAQQIIERLRGQGGVIESFYSYGGGLPEPSFHGNPLRYCITWNPRNVVMAAEHGAEYLHGGRVKIIPWHRVFESTWQVEVPGLGGFEAYANRDSLSYRHVHQLGSEVHTLVRATLRYPGFCDLWRCIVRLGLPNERVEVPRLAERSYRDLLEMFLPENSGGGALEQRLARFLSLAPESEEMRTLEWLGFFDPEPCGVAGDRPAHALIALLERRLPLPPEARDLVVLHHDLEVRYPGEARRERVLSTFVHYGDPGGVTAMARGVGLPAALGTRLLLEDRLRVRGALQPTRPEIYQPILSELARAGLAFEEEVRPLPADDPS